MSSTTLDAAAASSASLSSVLASASAALASASSASAAAAEALASATGTSGSHGMTGSNHPPSYKIIGIVLAVVSGAFIGSSFVFKKKGLLSMQNKPGFVAGEGHAYLKSPMWWTGMILMIVGEICNFVAYAFTEAILVTPLGALSVVICAVLSSIFLKERLTFFGKIGCLLCILGAVIIALNGPQSGTATTIPEFQKFFLAPGFLAFGSVIIVTSLGLIFWVGPRYGKKNMLVYISICSMIGGLSVVCTSGLGASILTSINGNNQFKHWFIYFLLGFVIVTLLTEINYLNKALELFNTAMVTPTYYVIFTFCTLVTDVILNQGFAASAVQIVTVVFGFFTICCGITLLQMSKLDPAEVAARVKIDRRSTMLLTAANKASKSTDDVSDDAEKSNLDLEDPGVDSVRGFVGIAGSVHRAISARRSILHRRRSQASAKSQRSRMLMEMQQDPAAVQRYSQPVRGADGVLRHSLYDSPMRAPSMPDDAMERISQHSGSNTANVYATSDAHSVMAGHLPYTANFDTAAANSTATKRRPTIGFNEDVIEHRYPRVGEAGQATHQPHYPPAYVPAPSPRLQNPPFLTPGGRTGSNRSTAVIDEEDTSPVEASIIEAYDTTPRPERYATHSGMRQRSVSPSPGPSPISSTAHSGAARMINAHSLSSAGHATLEQRQSYRNMLEERFQPEHTPDLRLSAGDHIADEIGEHGQRATPRQRSGSRGVNNTHSPTMREMFDSFTDHLQGHSAGRRGRDNQPQSDDEEAEERRGLVGAASQMGSTAQIHPLQDSFGDERVSWDSDLGGRRNDSLDSLSSSPMDGSVAKSSDNEAYRVNERSAQNSNRPVRRV